MKMKITLMLSILSLILVSGFLVYNQEVMANFLTKKTVGSGITYDDYSKMEKKRDRNNTFQKETPENKSILWRQHLAYAGARLDLNEIQRDFLYKLSEFLDANFFVTLESKKGTSEFDFAKSDEGKSYGELMKQVPELFKQEQIKQIFLTIGDTSTITDWSCGGSASTDTKAENLNNTQSLSLCTCTGSFCGSGCREGSTCQMGFPHPNCTEGGNCGCGSWFACTAKCSRQNE